MQNLMPPINTPDQLFHDGDPTQGIEGTLVTAGYLNNQQGATRDLQQELLNVLGGAHIQPDPQKTDQLLTALRALLLSRKNPFGDIKLDGTVQKALENLGLGELALAGATTGAMLVNGYVAIPLIISGVRRPLIIQWGVGQFGGSLGDDAGYLNNFPFAFPSACYVMVASHVGHTPSSAGILSASAITKSGFRGFSSVVTAANPVSGCYVAIGG